jgi:hypothetical protein
MRQKTGLKGLTPISSAHSHAEQKHVCGFRWEGPSPYFDQYVCTRDKGHEGQHRTKQGNRKDP